MKKILMVTFSRHASFQDGVFSMYHQLKDRYDVWTVTRKNDDYPAPHEEHNCFVSAPENPGLSKETFNIAEWHRMMKIVRKIHPDIIYIESFHVWNYPIMFYCKHNNVTLAVSHILYFAVNPHIRLREFTMFWRLSRRLLKLIQILYCSSAAKI